MPLDQVMAMEDIEAFTYDDIPDTHWGLTAITEMGNVGLALPLKATEPTKFSPNTTAQRDFTVATCVRLIEAPYSQDSVIEPPDSVPFIDLADSATPRKLSERSTPTKLWQAQMMACFARQNPSAVNACGYAGEGAANKW